MIENKNRHLTRNSRLIRGHISQRNLPSGGRSRQTPQLCAMAMAMVKPPRRISAVDIEGTRHICKTGCRCFSAPRLRAIWSCARARKLVRHISNTCAKTSRASVALRSTAVMGWKRRWNQSRWGWQVGVRLGYVQQQVHPRLSTRPQLRAYLPTRP